MYSFFTSVLLALSSSYAFAAPSHGISMHGELKYPKDFTHFDYVNPNAPQGGKLTLSKTGTFTTFNPLVLKGTAAPGIRGGSYGRGYIYESLMARSQDEAFSLYGLLAKSVDLSEDRSQITFNIRDEARWSDGHPLTAEDVAFSVDLYKTKGHPRLRDVAKAVTHTVSGNSITFVFKNTENRELPLLLGLMPIVPKHIIDPYFFDRTTLEIPVGSGPYVISRVQPGRQVVYKKNPNYWGKDLAVNKGHYNFQYIKYEYFRDHNSSFESFKKGIVDFWFESSPSSWATRFNFSALKSGQAKKEEIAIT